MKRLITFGVMLVLALVLFVGLTSCSTDVPVPTPPDMEQPPPTGSDQPGNNNPDDNNSMRSKLKINIGSASFNVTLEDNATVAALKALLPMTVNMPDMNGNEKYYYLPEDLPTASSNPGTIRAGDLMLYGSSCMVLFYEDFSTSYSYTRLGHVDNPSELASALGAGSATITFELQ